jgi:large subunit ribosomal protein L11
MTLKRKEKKNLIKIYVSLSSVVCSIIGSAHSRVVKDLSAEELATFQKEKAMFLAAPKEADLAAQAEAAKK